MAGRSVRYWLTFDECPSCGAKPATPCVGVKAPVIGHLIRQAHEGRKRMASTPPSHNDLDLTYPALGDMHVTPEQRQNAARVVYNYVKTLPPEEQDFAWQEVAGALGVEADLVVNQ